MKDKQFQSAGPAPGIPVISPVLHVFSMPALVFLRSSFGYAFLSPKSIFLACAWAHGLFAYYAWHEPGAWPRWKPIVLFGTAAFLLYLAHLLRALRGELRRKGKHDYYAGTSHFMRLAGLFRPGIRDQLAAFTHLWLEPALVLFISLASGMAGISKLPSVLGFLALCLWSKEAINYWYRLRHQKKQTDVFADAEEGLDSYAHGQPAVTAGGGGRKPRQKRARVTGTVEQGADLDRHAETLRMLPPYSLEQAETNYRTLIKACHPDSGAAPPDASSRAAKLKEALAFFRGQEDATDR
jgi:hypothetical protein